MPEVNSKKFVQLFQQALAKGGTLTEGDVEALKAAKASIKDANERKAAAGLLSMVGHDRELDSFEVAPARKALGALLGVSRGPLPADLEKVLARAVPQANVGVKHYGLTFDFSKDGSTFPARALLTLDKKAPKEIVLEAHADRLAISKVLVDGEEVPFEVKENRLHVIAPGAKTLDIAYTVAATSASDTAYGLIRDSYSGRMWTLTWPYNTGALFPSNSAPSDGSTSSVTVKVADGTTAVAGGDLEKGAFVDSMEGPAYGVAVYLGRDFETVSAGKSADGVAVTGYGLARAGIDRKVREAYVETAKKSLDFYSRWLGEYEYGNALKLVEVEGGLGGMEHTGAVAIMSSSARDPSFSKETAAHETAHHWFGDNVRIKTWGDFWMSEGFTNYATYRYFRESEGEARYQKLWDGAKSRLRFSFRSNPHALAEAAHTDVNAIFDEIPYEMGAWMLRMMEAQVGTAAFDALLRDWYSSHKGKAVSTSEFVRFAKEKTGRDFGPFFKAWNGITAVPTFRSDIRRDGTKVSIALNASTPVPEGMSLPLRLEGDGGRTLLVTVDPTRPFTVDAGFTVKGWTWDPERTVLADVY